MDGRMTCNQCGDGLGGFRSDDSVRCGFWPQGYMCDSCAVRSGYATRTYSGETWVPRNSVFNVQSAPGTWTALETGTYRIGDGPPRLIDPA